MTWLGPDYNMQFVPDRASRVLTYTPHMLREQPPIPERASIFGDTYDGVPSPNVPFEHGYPTRYHGPIWTYPRQGYGYKRATYVKTPFLGFGQAESAITTRTLMFVGAGALLLFAIARDRGSLLGMKPSTAALVGAAVGALFVSSK